MSKIYIVKEENGALSYNDALMLDKKGIKEINGTRIDILKLLSKKPMYPAEIAKELKIHEQKIYYHIRHLHNAGLLDIVEKKEVRGTIAKKYSPKNTSFALTINNEWKDFNVLKKEKDAKIELFLKPLIENRKLNSHFIVGSPDPHGPLKSRARDGHYAIDLALFIGEFCEVPSEFCVSLDVDAKTSKATMENLIVIGGPVNNMISAEINEKLPIRFSDKKPYGIVSKKAKYTDESVGLIAKIPSPFNNAKYVIFIAGISSIGTKAAVLAITRHYREILQTYTGQKEWASVVQGFDLDGDGKIDSIEVLE